MLHGEWLSSCPAAAARSHPWKDTGTVRQYPSQPALEAAEPGPPFFCPSVC